MNTAFWTDAELITSCRTGQAEAWDALVERYAQLVYAVPHALGLAEQAAEVCQATFQGLHQHLAAVSVEEPLAHWLLRVAQQESWRVSARQKGGDESSLPPLDEATARRLQERHLLRLAISQLALPCQALLRLCFAERPRPSAAEAALALHLSAENLDAAQARCLQRLHHALSRLGYLWPASEAENAPAPEPARSEDATTL